MPWTLFCLIVGCQSALFPAATVVSTNSNDDLLFFLRRGWVRALVARWTCVDSKYYGAIAWLGERGLIDKCIWQERTYEWRAKVILWCFTDELESVACCTSFNSQTIAQSIILGKIEACMDNRDLWIEKLFVRHVPVASNNCSRIIAARSDCGQRALVMAWGYSAGPHLQSLSRRSYRKGLNTKIIDFTSTTNVLKLSVFTNEHVTMDCVVVVIYHLSTSPFGLTTITLAPSRRQTLLRLSPVSLHPWSSAWSS